ncbi:TRAP transporter permease [Sulfitobacter geojensis]|uniref:TRAP transporter fused permease subunit n=1 Tax=Sulfitobacter geojensis TaxID=1342299 RepID=A0AAE3B7F7_9RHOB|nr:TRAP transporter fused permease subunit [Sulfitobacter geojensis]MBM1690855.1 TRAP transporter fused permease subunit [Sulfitobacter geojensis]MBM1694921.1 TRAP transporter fused permease subunit [Sulfitobacter geojensis]MBM1706925.1 TRAP transporter fused permease subunit [Sulfitobacter geojensis]MBM1710983.1 TRAP transporter fused permease subunit [Sulfitobacter geojensis]MBM1715049.1 TRAP transporter fused permease subunit [Sulfitobacter geojensis]
MTDQNAQTPLPKGVEQVAIDGGTPSERIAGPARWVVVAGTLFSLILVINQLFNLQILGIVLIEGRYLYILGGLFLALSFLIFQMRGGKGGVPSLLDWALFALALACTGYLAQTAQTNLSQGWEYAAPQTAQYVSVAFFFLILEATRRAGGLVLFLIVCFFAFYPTFAGHVPDPFSGFQSTLMQTVPYHVFSAESSFGIPMKAFGGVVIGFILFGAVLQRTGGGQFFNDLALGLVGGYRGGAAKVSIFASGFMGSMSGSVISNVLTTGAVSIPAMRKTGFSAKTAAATEACASTGGVLMPPIMGATAFIMASFLSRPYVEIALAAAIPSILFYWGLFTGIDAYAAKRGLRGLPRPDLPRLKEVMKEGWPYIFVFALLLYMMIGLRQESSAPFYATALLLVVNQFRARFRLNKQRLGNMIVGVGMGLAELTAILLGVGLIVGSFSATGLAGTLVNELVFMAGDNTLVLLLMGAMTAFIFGMGMTVTACYIFLAVVLAPALEAGGLNTLAVHLFILYWGMVSYITPPVALGAFAASTMAGSNPIATGFEAMRLGGVIYIAPFFFVLNPALIGQAPAWEVVVALSCAMIGVAMISSALQGYISLIGPLEGASGMPLRILLFCGGVLIAMPQTGLVSLGYASSFLIGAVLCALPMFTAWRSNAAGPNPT